MFKKILCISILSLLLILYISNIALSESLPDSSINNIEVTGDKGEINNISRLFYCNPLGFNQETFTKLYEDIYNIPYFISSNSDIITENIWQVSLIGLFILFFIIFYFFEKRLFKLGIKISSKITNKEKSTLTYFLFFLLIKTLPFFIALIILNLLTGALGETTFLNVLLALSLIWLIYRIIYSIINTIFLKQFGLIEVHSKIALRVYKYFHIVILIATICYSIITILEILEHHSDVIALLKFIFYIFLLLICGGLFLRKKDIILLLPVIENKIYEKFMVIMDKFYSYLIGFTVILAILWIIGYKNLANALLLRSWAVVGVLIGILFIHHYIKKTIQKYTTTITEPESPVKIFYNELFKVIKFIEIIFFIYIILHLFEIYNGVISVLSFPILHIHQIPITLFGFAKAVLIFIIFLLLIRLVTSFLEARVYPDLDLDTGTTTLINVALKYFLLVVGILFALNILGIDLTVLTVFAGALGIGIGLGLQGIARNFASGMVLIFGKMVKKGDFISSGDYIGYVTEVSLRFVSIRTTRGIELMVPSAQLIDSTIINWTRGDPKIRVHIPIGVSYGSDVEMVKQALLDAAKQHAEVLDEPAPEVWLKDFGNSSINFELLVWINHQTINAERLTGEINFLIWYSLKKYNIEIPFPQRDVHIKSS